MANPQPGPNVGGDFPDAPAEAVAARPEDKPDPDKFAARLGLVPDSADSEQADSDGEGDDAVAGRLGSLLDRLKPTMSKVADKVSSGFDAASDRLVDLTERDVDDESADPTLADLIKRVESIRTVMVTTGDERGTLSSRPLTVQEVSDDGDVFFIVNRDADWVTSMVEAANVAFVRRDRDWISVAGRAALSEDRSLLDELWNPATDAFFPGGKDSGAAVLSVHADRWEYWSAPNQVAKFVEVARAAVSDDTADLGDSGAIET